MPISVTIVGTRDRQLEDTLRAQGIQPTTISASALSALSHPSAVPPDVVLFDLRTDSQLPTGIAGLKRQHTAIGLAILVKAFDQALMLQAMRAGVTECIASTDPQELVTAVARLTAERMKPAAGDVFVFVGAKGGAGTTTCAVNVATALARVDSTLLIDLHAAGGDAGLLLGAEPRFSVFDALENMHRLDTAYFRGLVVRTRSEVDLLGSADRVMVKPIDTDLFRTLINFAARHYRYTVLDVPRSDATVLDALEGATTLTVVTNQELAAVRAGARLCTTLRQRYGREKIRVVVSRTDELADIRRRDVEEAVGTAVKHTIPSDYRLAVEAMNRGRPLVLDGGKPLATAYQALARDLAGLLPEKPETERSGGLFGRLTGAKGSTRKA